MRLSRRSRANPRRSGCLWSSRSSRPASRLAPHCTSAPLQSRPERRRYHVDQKQEVRELYGAHLQFDASVVNSDEHETVIKVVAGSCDDHGIAHMRHRISQINSVAQTISAARLPGQVAEATHAVPAPVAGWNLPRRFRADRPRAGTEIGYYLGHRRERRTLRVAALRRSPHSDA